MREESNKTGIEAPSAQDRIHKLHELREKTQESWRKASESISKYYNQRHKPMEFRVGDLVRLSTKNLRLKSLSNKLSPKFIGPFKPLEKVGKQAYRLGLPTKYDRLHNVFPITLLEPWKSRKDGETTTLPELQDDMEWEIE
ncbi:hypothetical protein N7495_007186 [Penicillium taxi]|uniref:uncharacterized protein n=1 Tax=Penicillium taxi TaxID=168475 RepID=UPI002544FA77|nr:uncharacterized protein N7495_007186 [Penicillium taxi]KAJ5895495.1 hypothetical protein N7495_007186 [Penicillium taxi]